MKNNKNNLKMGLLFGIIVGIAWGLDTVLMGMLGGREVFSEVASSTKSLVAAFFMMDFVLFG